MTRLSRIFSHDVDLHVQFYLSFIKNDYLAFDLSLKSIEIK